MLYRRLIKSLREINKSSRIEAIAGRSQAAAIVTTRADQNLISCATRISLSHCNPRALLSNLQVSFSHFLMTLLHFESDEQREKILASLSDHFDLIPS